MTKVDIHPEYNQYYARITTMANTPCVFSPIAVLEILGSTLFYRIENETPLVLKLYKSDGKEISGHSKICLCGIPPYYTREEMMNNDIIDNKKYCSGILSYRVFERISIGDQEKNETRARRLIRFDKEADILTPGLSPGCKLLLMLCSPDIIDWERSEFNFDMYVEYSQIDKTN